MSPIKKPTHIWRVGAVCNCNSSKTLTETMRRRASALLSIAFLSVFLFASFSLYYSRNPISISEVLYPATGSLAIRPNNAADSNSNLVIQEELNHRTRRVSSVQDSGFINSVSVLLPDWQVLLIVSPDMDSQMLSGQNLTCLYPSKSTAPAKFSGFLRSLNQITFKCFLPKGARRRYPFLAPILTRLPVEESLSYWRNSPPLEMLRWNHLVYESFSTENDVVVFAKGLNNRQGINKSPREFKCVFIDEANNDTVITAVTSSMQEVFRCNHPDLTAFGSGGDDSIKLKVSLQILEQKRVVPSVAYYTSLRKIAKEEPKSQLCASTMVYNVGKFLREWIMYHSKIGVEKFILYDNDSDDDLITVVKDLNQEGYNIETVLWLWPKTQEAGFSHAALYANKSCNWMMYVDVDEFVFSPSWENSFQPSGQMLKSLLPSLSEEKNDDMIGEVSIMCNEFGPSNQRSNPIEGVTQGYNCRRKLENRHKSIVLLEAIDNSLLNVIHHFTIKENYGWKQLSLEEAVVNHYKYQTWSEFKAKFRRRVSAYVVDWMKEMNPSSKDRTPGLGFEAKEPPGWENKFCEIRDDRLKLLMQRWFGIQTETDQYRMAWQS